MVARRKCDQCHYVLYSVEKFSVIGVALRIFFAVAGSWIIKAGFIKYFTKVSYQKA